MFGVVNCMLDEHISPLSFLYCDRYVFCVFVSLMLEGHISPVDFLFMQ